LDETTFGSFDAAKRLVKEVEDNPKLANKIGNLLQDYTEGLSNIAQISDNRYKRRILSLWKDDFLKHCEDYYGVVTLLKNVVVAYYRNTTRRKNVCSK
jgi:hypothetical protein